MRTRKNVSKGRRERCVRNANAWQTRAVPWGTRVFPTSDDVMTPSWGRNGAILIVLEVLAVRFVMRKTRLGEQGWGSAGVRMGDVCGFPRIVHDNDGRCENCLGRGYWFCLSNMRRTYVIAEALEVAFWWYGRLVFSAGRETPPQPNIPPMHQRHPPPPSARAEANSKRRSYSSLRLHMKSEGTSW